MDRLGGGRVCMIRNRSHDRFLGQGLGGVCEGGFERLESNLFKTSVFEIRVDKGIWAKSLIFDKKRIRPNTLERLEFFFGMGVLLIPNTPPCITRRELRGACLIFFLSKINR